MDTEFWFTIGMVLFGIGLIVWIFCKSHIDNQKQKKQLTALYQKYGVRTNAEVIDCRNHVHTERTRHYKYELSVSFEYNSPIKGQICPCLAKILTNHPDCKKYKKLIPIIYIPQYADYLNEFHYAKEICRDIGINVYRYDEMILFADDISFHTNLSE